MSDADQLKVPGWFKVVNILLLLWNLFGFAIFVATISVYNNQQALLDAGLTQEQADIQLATPGWVYVAFCVAVTCGVAGCVALLLRKKMAVQLVAVSLVGVLAQNTYTYLLSDVVKVMGPGPSPLVILVGIGLIPWAMSARKKGWLT